MTKKDYQIIADVIRAALTSSMVTLEALTAERAVEYTALDLADVFQSDNPQFNREKFLEACGITH